MIEPQRRQYPSDPVRTLKKIDDAVHNIWAYVRENRDSLSADVTHRMIVDYVADVRMNDAKEIERLTAHVERLKGENKALDDRISQLKKMK